MATASTTDESKSALQPTVCPGHVRGVTELDFSPATADGVFLVSGCQDKLPMLRNGDTGDWIGTFSGHKGVVWSAKINRSATAVMTGSADYTAKLWNALTGEQSCEYEHPHIVRAVAFAPNDKLVATACRDNNIRVFTTTSTEAVHKIDAGSVVRKIIFSEDSSQIITGDEAGYIRLYELASGKVLRESKVTDSVSDLELSFNNSLLIAAAGKKVIVLDAATFAVRHSHSFDCEMQAASLHPITGDKFVCGGDDMIVRLVDLVSGQELAVQRGHHGPVHCVRFHPSGKVYATGSGDATIRLWPTVADAKK